MNIVINPIYNHLETFLKTLPQQFERSGELIYSGRNKVKRFVVNGETYVVKRFKRPNLVQAIVYAWFRPSKARRAYEYAFRLQQLGIDTPEPIAYIDIKSAMTYCDGYFISRTAEGESCGFLRDLGEQVIESGRYDNLLKALAKEIADIHRKGFMHGDINLSNIFYVESPEGYRFSFIDINRSYFNTHPTVKEKAKNMMRLTHERFLLKRIIDFYNESVDKGNRVEFRFVEQELNKFARHKKFVYVLKGKKW